MNEKKPLYRVILLITLALYAAVALLLRAMAPDWIESLWLFLFCIVLIVLTELRHGFSLRIPRACLLGAALMAVSAFFSFLINSQTLEGRPIGKVIISLLYFLFYALLFQSLGRLDHIAVFGRPERVRHLSPRSILALGAVFLLVLLVEYKRNYPFGITPDAYDQWIQIHGLVPYNTIHSLFHTFFLKCLLHLWDNYTIVIWFHILAVVVFYLVMADFFCSRAMPLLLVGFMITMGLIWTNAATWAYFYPWKDTPSALCLAVVTLFLARLTEEDKPLGIGGAVLLGAALAGCVLFRKNGIIAFAVCSVCCLVLFRKRRQTRQLLAMLLTVVISISAVELYTSLVMRPEKMENGFSLQIFGTAIAAVVHEDTLTESELEEIDQVLPVDWMREKYSDSRLKRALIWDGDDSEVIAEHPSMYILNNDFVIAMGENKVAVIRLFFRLLPKHFLTIARDLVGSMETIWMQDIQLFTATHVFWAIAVGVAIVRLGLRRTLLLPFLPCICNTISIMISTTTNEMRYLLPTYMLAPFFVLYLLWQKQKRSKADSPA